MHPRLDAVPICSPVHMDMDMGCKQECTRVYGRPSGGGSGLSAGRAPPRSAVASAAQPPSVMAFSRSLLPGPRSSTRGLPLSLPWEIRELGSGR